MCGIHRWSGWERRTGGRVVSWTRRASWLTLTVSGAASQTRSAITTHERAPGGTARMAVVRIGVKVCRAGSIADRSPCVMKPATEAGAGNTDHPGLSDRGWTMAE